jgi:hypothetical protein
MTPNERTLDYLMQLPPVPIVRLNWSRCGVDKPTLAYQRLTAQRFRAGKILWQDTATDVHTLQANVADLTLYAKSLLDLIRCAKLPARLEVLCFDWAFPAETTCAPRVKNTEDEIMDMRSAYIAFEYLCVSVGAAIFSFRAAKLTRAQHPDDIALVTSRYAETCAYLKELHESYPRVLALEQWATLRSQGLPMQIQEHWIALFRAHVQYKMACLPVQGDVRLMRAAAWQYAQSALDWLRDPAVSEAQTPVVQCAYDATLHFAACQDIQFMFEAAKRAEDDKRADVAHGVMRRIAGIIGTFTDKQRAGLGEVQERCAYELEVTRKMCQFPAADAEIDALVAQADELQV